VAGRVIIAGALAPRPISLTPRRTRIRSFGPRSWGDGIRHWQIRAADLSAVATFRKALARYSDV